jgi:hypothetical protein
MKRAVFFVLFVSSFRLVHSQNLVVNPGLENWESSTKPTGWTTSTKCNSEQVNFHSGTLSCKHSGSASSRGDMGQLIPVSSGKTYTLSFYYLTGTPTTGVGARIWSYWKNSEGSSITDPATDDLLRSDYLSSPVWAQYSVNITAPAGATAIYLEVRTYINSIMYWDDFVFEESIATGFSGDVTDKLKIYPVPAADYLKIGNCQGFKAAEIICLNGNILKSVPLEGSDELTIALNDLIEGIYLLRVTDGKKTVLRKFIKK